MTALSRIDRAFSPDTSRILLQGFKETMPIHDYDNIRGV